MNGKQFTIATLFAAVLLTLVFIPLARQQGGGTYDPWLDYNEDGKIDVNELYPLGQTFGSTGNPTKNVTIVGHASNVIQAAVAVTMSPSPSPEFIWDSGAISVKNYSKVTVLIYMNQTLNSYYLYATDGAPSVAWLVEEISDFGNYNLVKTYDVMNVAIQITLKNNSPNPAIIYVDIYLMA